MPQIGWFEILIIVSIAIIVIGPKDFPKVLKNGQFSAQIPKFVVVVHDLLFFQPYEWYHMLNIYQVKYYIFHNIQGVKLGP